MNGNLVFVLCIIGIVMCANIIRNWLKHMHEKPVVDEEMEETLAKIDLLEERLQVLERIVTEKRFDLKREIDSL